MLAAGSEVFRLFADQLTLQDPAYSAMIVQRALPTLCTRAPWQAAIVCGQLSSL